jgi:acetyl-CoA carboxylase biotin carboxyl carrier protein
VRRIAAIFLDKFRRNTVAEIKAPMGGKVIKVSVNVGDTVSVDDEVAVLEAMKMEMPILAEDGGTVSAVKVEAGQTVEAEQVMLELE